MFFSTDIELDPTEVDYVSRQLQIIGEFDKRELPSIMADTRKDLHNAVGKYAPPLANQRYIRTGTYGDSVFSEQETVPNGIMITAGSRGAIQNGRRYDQFLKDARNQAGIHAGRWTTLQEDADATMPKLERRLQAAQKRMKL